MLRALWESFKRNDRGQGLSEYCLLAALVALVGLGIFVHASGGLQSIWAEADSSLAASKAAAATSGVGPGTAGPAAATTSPGSR